MEEQVTPRQVGAMPPRLDGDTVKDRLNRLFEFFPNPDTGLPYTNEQAAARIAAMGAPIHRNTIAGARRGETEPSLKHARAIHGLFPAAPGDYLMVGTEADRKAIAAQDAQGQGQAKEAADVPVEAATEEDLRALARLFGAPEEVLTSDTDLGKDFDLELQSLIAQRRSGAHILAFAMRYDQEPDAEVKQQMIRQLEQAGRIGRRLLARRRATDSHETRDRDGDS